jgi:hypothetical protein
MLSNADIAPSLSSALEGLRSVIDCLDVPPPLSV